MLEQSRL